jgi:toxin ParE1/3/4
VTELLVSRRAEDDLRYIWRQLAGANPAAADRLMLRLDKKLHLLRDFPGMGTVRDDIRSGFRMLVEGNYLLLYEHRAVDNAIELIAVVDGRRDLKGLF